MLPGQRPRCRGRSIYALGSQRTPPGTWPSHLGRVWAGWGGARWKPSEGQRLEWGPQRPHTLAWAADLPTKAPWAGHGIADWRPDSSPQSTALPSTPFPPPDLLYLVSGQLLAARGLIRPEMESLYVPSRSWGSLRTVFPCGDPRECAWSRVGTASSRGLWGPAVLRPPREVARSQQRAVSLPARPQTKSPVPRPPPAQPCVERWSSAQLDVGQGRDRKGI